MTNNIKFFVHFFDQESMENGMDGTSDSFTTTSAEVALSAFNQPNFQAVFDADSDFEKEFSKEELEKMIAG